MKLLGKQIIVQFDKPVERKVGILVLPDVVREHKYGEAIPGKVLFIGHKVKLPIKVNDVVYVPEQFGTELTLNEKKVKVYNEEDVLAVKEV